MSGRAIRLEGQGGWPAEDVRSLVREVHHRVSNHLQILASVIGLQARSHPEPTVAEALLEVRARILAIARLNAELQQAEQGDTIEVSRFLGRLAQELRLSFNADSNLDLNLDLDIERFETNSDMAMTIGLIFNELVTNAIKYAVLPIGGTVRVSFRRQPDGEWRLMVRDEGPGLAAGVLHADPGHGISLINTLVQKLKGKLSVERSQTGAAISVSFY